MHTHVGRLQEELQAVRAELYLEEQRPPHSRNGYYERLQEQRSRIEHEMRTAKQLLGLPH